MNISLRWNKADDSHSWLLYPFDEAKVFIDEHNKIIGAMNQEMTQIHYHREGDNLVTEGMAPVELVNYYKKGMRRWKFWK